MILKTTLVLTVAGRSQHLSRLIQLKLQIISNIWSWNYTTEEGEKIEGCYKWLPFIMKTHTVEKRQQWVPQRTIKMLTLCEQLKLNCASTCERFWILIIWKVARCCSKHMFFSPRGLHFKRKGFLFSLTVADCLLPPPDLTILPSTS